MFRVAHAPSRNTRGVHNAHYLVTALSLTLTGEGPVNTREGACAPRKELHHYGFSFFEGYKLGSRDHRALAPSKRIVTSTNDSNGGNPLPFTCQLSSLSLPGRGLLISASVSSINDTTEPSRCAMNVPSNTFEPVNIQGPRRMMDFPA